MPGFFHPGQTACGAGVAGRAGRTGQRADRGTVCLVIYRLSGGLRRRCDGGGKRTAKQGGQRIFVRGLLLCRPFQPAAAPLPGFGGGGQDLCRRCPGLRLLLDSRTPKHRRQQDRTPAGPARTASRHGGYSPTRSGERSNPFGWGGHPYRDRRHPRPGAKSERGAARGDTDPRFDPRRDRESGGQYSGAPG